jgi:uncharacterized membrane protein YeaQ/YmgE (transglycosylase-associated protein family)
MSIAVFVSWALVGVLAGALAGYAMKSGGYGLRWDIILGFAGSLVGNWIVMTLGVFPQAEMATTVVAFVGATVSIVAQRKAWPMIV